MKARGTKAIQSERRLPASRREAGCCKPALKSGDRAQGNHRRPTNMAGRRSYRELGWQIKRWRPETGSPTPNPKRAFRESPPKPMSRPGMPRWHHPRPKVGNIKQRTATATQRRDPRRFFYKSRDDSTTSPFPNPGCQESFSIPSRIEPARGRMIPRNHGLGAVGACAGRAVQSDNHQNAATSL
jgi:hypothetical protein